MKKISANDIKKQLINDITSLYQKQEKENLTNDETDAFIFEFTCHILNYTQENINDMKINEITPFIKSYLNYVNLFNSRVLANNELKKDSSAVFFCSNFQSSIIENKKAK